MNIMEAEAACSSSIIMIANKFPIQGMMDGPGIGIPEFKIPLAS
jgi:hypothetical protein